MAGFAAATIALFIAVIVAVQEPGVTVVPENAPAAESSKLYALLARGFLQGHLSIAATPSPELLALRDPYDPAARQGAPYLHDASLFGGRYYIYFGPAPALLLFAPWRLITGTDLATSHAVFAFASAACLGLLAIVQWFGRRYYPGASPVAQCGALLTVSGASLLLPLVRRPGVYEVAISCGAAAAIWGLYCACRSRSASDRMGWPAAAGLLFGLAVASRPTLGLAALGAVAIMRGESTRAGRAPHRCILVALATGSIVVGLLGWYNHARFGNPLEFGQRYQLSSINEGAADHFSARYLLTQLWLYLFSPLECSRYFPFLQTAAAADLPPGFWAHEFSFGLLANLPVAWFGFFAACAIALRRPTAGVLGGLMVATAAVMAPLLLFFASAVRYEAEFTPLVMLVAAGGIFELDATIARQHRTKAAWAALMLALVSAVAVLLASVDMYSGTRHTHPPRLDSIGYWLNRPAAAWDAARGRRHGPVYLRLRSGTAPRQRECVLVATGAGGSESVALEPAGGSQLRIVVSRHGPEPFEVSAVVERQSGLEQHQLAVSMSSLFPTRAIELRSRVARSEFTALKTWVRVDWDGQRVLEEHVSPAPWRTASIKVTPEAIAAAGFSPFGGEIISNWQGDNLPTISAARLGGIRLRVRLYPENVGHSFPIGVSGQTGRGNLLFLQVTAADEVRFGYDHWGKPVILSRSVPVNLRNPHVIEFWMPSFRAASAPSPLVVRLDGETVWKTSVPFYPAEAGEIFIARNSIGGSTCEPVFPFATVERTDLPEP
ncbi:MAG: hypothetical protein Q7S40_06790 [Opitutaceae bacterium]|nr:hypothetical protein [Opitutaceae bacterium]